MLETEVTGLLLVLGFSSVFHAAHRIILPITKLYSESLYVQVMKRKNGTEWQNIIVSYAHAVLCSLWITYCLMTAGPELSADLMHADVPSARMLLCMSSGYFLADTIDMMRTKTLTWDLALHHVVVLTTYNLAILYGMFAPYLMGTLIVEYNNVFLHQRRLYLLSGGKKSRSSTFYMNVLYCLIGTYPLFRFVPHGYLIHRVMEDYGHFPEMWMYWMAFMGMLVMNILNVVLLGLIVSGDRKVLFSHDKASRHAD